MWGNLCPFYFLINWLLPLTTFPVSAKPPRTAKATSTPSWYCCTSTPPCWPSSSFSSAGQKTITRPMRGNWNWTYRPIIFQRTANTWRPMLAPARLWLRCYTTSCWPRLCGTASMALSWCCWFAVYAVACQHTGPDWVTLSAGVSVLSQDGFSIFYLFKLAFPLSRTCCSGALIPANQKKDKKNVLVCFFIEFEWFFFLRTACRHHGDHTWNNLSCGRPSELQTGRVVSQSISESKHYLFCAFYALFRHVKGKKINRNATCKNPWQGNEDST